MLSWGKSTSATYRTAVKEYLEDEVEAVTPAPLMRHFADEVDELKLATDRLSARIDRLSARQAKAEED